MAIATEVLDSFGKGGEEEKPKEETGSSWLNPKMFSMPGGLAPSESSALAAAVERKEAKPKFSALEKLVVGSYPQAEPRDDLEEFHQEVRNRLRHAAHEHSKVLDAVVGLGYGVLGRGVGGLFSLAGSLPLDPTNVGAKIVDYALSKNPSDLVLPHHPADSPTGKRLRVLSDEFDKAFRYSSIAKFAAFVGEFIPSIYLGAKVANVTQGMAITEGPKLLKTLGTSKLANRFSTKAAQALAEIGDSVAADVAGRAKLEIVGGIPFAEKMMMAVGNSMGWGTLEAARQLGNTGDTQVALKVGGLVAVGGAVGEVGLSALGRKLFPKTIGRPPINLKKAWEEYEKLEASINDKVLSGDAAGLEFINGSLTIDELTRKKGADYLGRGERAISKLIDLEVLEQAPGFAKALKKMTPSEAKQVIQRVGELYREADLSGMMKDMSSAAKRKSWESLPRSKRMLTETPTMRRGFERAGRHRLFKIRGAEQELRATTTAMDALDEATVAPNLRRLLDDTPVSPAQRLKELGTLEEALKREAAKQMEAGGSASFVTKAKILDNAMRQGMWGLYSDILERFIIKWGISPEGLAKKLGIPGLKVLTLTQGAEAEIKSVQMKTWVSLNRMSREIAELGKGNKAFAHHMDGTVVTENAAHINMVRDTYEMGGGKVGGGLAAVQERFGPEIRRIWQQKVVNTLDYYGEELQKLGVNSMMSGDELVGLGVGEYFPHVIKSGTNWAKIEKQISESLSKRGYNDTQIREILARGGWKTSGLRQFGTIDQQRMMTGTTQQKLAYGVPLEENALETLRQHFNASQVRLSMGRRFGANGELGSYYKAAMVNVGGSEGEANALVDTILFESAPNQAAAKWARRVTSAQIMAKLTFAVIPNAFQTTITAIRFGPKAAMLGTKEALKDAVSNWKVAKPFRETLASADKEIVENALGFMHRSLASLELPLKGGVPRTLSERVAEGYLKAIGFSMTERMNRVIAAHAGLAHSRMLLEKMARGELKGKAYLNAVRSLDSLGIDPVKIVDRYRVSGVLRLEREELDQIMTQAVKQTQFSTGPLDIPYGWRTPWGKIIMQFKTFAFSAGKTMRDQVWREFEQGNYRPFLYFMSLGGVSGEVIGDITAAARGREREFPNGPARIVEDLANFGGLGLALTLVESAAYGRVLESGLGPAVGDILGSGGLVSQTMQHGPIMGPLRVLERQPTARAVGRLAQGGYALGAALLDGGANALDKGWELMRREEVERKKGKGAAPREMGMDEIRRRLQEMD